MRAGSVTFQVGKVDNYSFWVTLWISTGRSLNQVINGIVLQKMSARSSLSILGPGAQIATRVSEKQLASR